MGWMQTVRRRLAEALMGGGWGEGAAISDAEPGYRRLTDESNTRNLTALSQAQMLKVCRWLYDGHAMGGWLIDHRVALTCGDELGFSVDIDRARLRQHGVRLSAKAEGKLAATIKARLEMFWSSPVFSIRTRADELFTSFLVDGELLLPIATTNETDGLPQIDMADVERIEAVRNLAGSGLIIDSVVLRPKTVGANPDTFRVIRLNPATQRFEGEAFFWRNCRLANASRGRSELLRQADWLDAQDQMLFARIDKATILNAMVWDVTLKNAGQSDIDKKREDLRKHPPTRPGTINVHNDSEEWQALTPSLESEDATNEMKHLQNFILGSCSVPQSWFGGAGEVTRTTASEQNDIALMILRRDRKLVRTIFGTLLHYAYDQLAEKNPAVYPPRAHGVTITVDLPPLDEKDISRLGGVIQNVESALESAIASQLVSRQTARETFLHLLDRLGVPVDPDTDKARIEEELADASEAQGATANATAAAALGRVDDDEDEDAEDAA